MSAEMLGSLGESVADPQSSKEEIGLNAALLGLFLPGKTKLLRGVGKYAFKGVRGTLDVAARPISYLDEKLKPVTNFVWENVVVPPFRARVIPTLEKMPGGKGSMEVVKKSVADIMQPAVERLSTNLQSTFRGTQAMKAHTTRIGERLGLELSSEMPSARLESIMAMRGTPAGSLRTESGRAFIDKWDDAIRDMQLKTPYEIEVKERTSRLLTDMVDRPHVVFTEDASYGFLKGLEEGIKGKPNFRKIQGSLRQAIEDPLVSDEFKQLARVIHDIPAAFPEAVAEASKASSTSFLASKLKGYKGVVRAYDPEPGSGNYLKSKWAPFQSKDGPLYVQRDVELELRALQDIPKIAHGAFNKYFLTPWKVFKVPARPAGQMRNMFGNTMLNHINGMPFWHMDTYRDATLGMMGKGNAISEVKRFMRTAGAGGNFSVNEVNATYEGLKYGSNMLDYGMSLLKQATQPAMTLYNAQETMFKAAKYLDNIRRKNMSHTEAVWDAVRSTFNYGEVTRATAHVRAKAAPFFTWQSKIVPMMAEAAVKNPVQFTSMITFYQMFQNYGIQQSGITEEEWAGVEGTMPEYIKKGMFLVMPWRDENDRLNLANMTYLLPGFGDLNQFQSESFTFFLSNPVLTISSAWLTNRKFSGAPICYDWESPATRFAKKASYTWEQLMPAIVPGGTDWNMLWRTFTDVPDSLTGPQAVSSALGFKLTPLDLQVAQRKAQVMTQIHLSEMGSAMNQELRKARNDEEREDIIAKYAELRQEFLEEQLPKE